MARGQLPAQLIATPGAALQRAWYHGSGWLWLLRPVEVVYRLAVALRLRDPAPVVVVGNITVGGTGKTPVVIALVEHLQALGVSVGVVSRGYGADAAPFPLSVSEASTALQCGDEPLLIFRRTGCPCVVAPDRAAAVRMLLEVSPVDIIISDDGMQHYAMARDLEIAMLDAQRGTGNNFCLPAGPLREPPGRLETVDYVLYRGGIQPETAVQYAPVCLVNLASGAQCPPTPAALASAVHAVAGVGQPQQFLGSLLALGFEPRPHIFPDHHRYSAEDFSGLDDRPIIMTEKDAVKCAGLAGANAWYLKIDALLPASVVQAVVALATSE
jgi:tetraacyldisaccharide 4'-kinase